MREENPNMDRNTRILTEDVRLPNEVCSFAGFAEHESRIAAVTVSTELKADWDEQRRAGAQGVLDILQSSPDLHDKRFLFIHRFSVEIMGSGRVVRHKAYWHGYYGYRMNQSIPGLVRGPDTLLHEEPGQLCYGSAALFPAESLSEFLRHGYDTQYSVWIPESEPELTEELVRNWFLYQDSEAAARSSSREYYHAGAIRVVRHGGVFLRIWPGDADHDPQQLTLFYRPDLVRMSRNETSL